MFFCFQKKRKKKYTHTHTYTQRCVYFSFVFSLGFVIQMVGLFWFATTKDIYTFYLARLLTGFGLGLTRVSLQSIMTARFAHNLTTAISYRGTNIIFVLVSNFCCYLFIFWSNPSVLLFRKNLPMPKKGYR